MILMDVETEREFGPGDLAIIQPGHDAWVVGDRPDGLLELFGDLTALVPGDNDPSRSRRLCLRPALTNLCLSPGVER